MAGFSLSVRKPEILLSGLLSDDNQRMMLSGGRLGLQNSIFWKAKTPTPAATDHIRDYTALV